MLISFVFVFMALLEYALVNYTFFGKKARLAKKKLKEQIRKKEIEVSLKVKWMNQLSSSPYVYYNGEAAVCYNF